MASTKYLWLLPLRVILHTQSYHLSMLQKYHFQWICHDYSRTCRLITYSLLGSSLRVLSPQAFYLKFLGQGILYDHPPHLKFPYHTINTILRGISFKSKLSQFRLTQKPSLHSRSEKVLSANLPTMGENVEPAAGQRQLEVLQLCA